jgi:hypothetical protein
MRRRLDSRLSAGSSRNQQGYGRHSKDCRWTSSSASATSWWFATQTAKLGVPVISGSRYHQSHFVDERVAETSITIPDCNIVIVSCREKQSSYDPRIVCHFLSKSSLPRRMQSNVKDVHAVSDQERVTSSCPKRRTTVLRIMASLKFVDARWTKPSCRSCLLAWNAVIATFLRTLLDPPSKASITTAIFCLQRLGVVTTAGDSGNLAPRRWNCTLQECPLHLLLARANRWLHPWMPVCQLGNGGRNEC